MKLHQELWLKAGVITWAVILEELSQRNLGGQKTSKIWRFFTTFKIDGKYLWNGSTQRKTETQLINYNPY